MFKRQVILIFLFFSLLSMGYAQKTVDYLDKDGKFKESVDLFNKKMYGSAQQSFRELLAAYGDADSDIKTDAEYYSAICALELFNSDAEYQITSFIDNHPESPRLNSAYFQLANFKYRQQKYGPTIKWLNKVDIDELNNEELAEYYFKYGHSAFVNEDYETAAKMLSEIKDAQTKYSTPAKYFYSHIQYFNKNYETALEGFNGLKDNALFAAFIPYYITQILYLQGKYDEVVKYAPPLLDSAATKRVPEISRVISESYFRLQKYKEALPYLNKYFEMTPAENINRNDFFEMGFLQYKVNDFKGASKNFEKVTGENDSISQNANYLLADCYLQLNDKTKALNAFYAASQYNFYPDLKEESAFSYAKLTYELSFSPFDQTINAFTDFIKDFPESDNLDEAYDYLGRVLYASKNYKAALEALENIKNIREDVREIYQRITFFRGIELFKDGQYEQSIILFDKSLNNSKADKNIKAEAIFWKAESYYRLNRFDEALKYYNDFVLSSGAYDKTEYAVAHYDIAYCYFKMNKYTEAIKWFRKYADMAAAKGPSKMLDDANIRTGDCYFVARKFDYATDYYGKAISAGNFDVDYALYQTAICVELEGKYNEKIIKLSQLINDFPNSAYVDDALFERGKAYMSIGENEMAVTDLTQLIDDFKKSPYIPEAHITLGLMYFNMSHYDDSRAQYQFVIDNYKGTPYFDEAMQALKTIYVNQGNIDDYSTYLDKKGLSKYLSDSEKDSLTYVASEKVYMDGRFSEAIPLFNKYITAFPDGRYVMNADFYRGESYLKIGDKDKAYVDYEDIVHRPPSQFTELALVRLCDLTYEKEDWKKALIYFTELYDRASLKTNLSKALFGMMEINYKLGNYDLSRQAAIELLKTAKLNPAQKANAHYYIAMSFFKTEKFNNAMDEFTMLANDPMRKEGAEARFRIIQIQYQQKVFDKVENSVFEFAKTNTPHQYWLGRSFILLADVYAQKENFVQAKATLQSIIDNYSNDNDGIKELAKSKLEQVEAQENAKKEKIANPEELNIDYTKDLKKDDLFKPDSLYNENTPKNDEE